MDAALVLQYDWGIMCLVMVFFSLDVRQVLMLAGFYWFSCYLGFVIS